MQADQGQESAKIFNVLNKNLCAKILDYSAII